MRLTTPSLVLAAALALAGCSASVSVGEKTLDKGEVADQIKTQLTQQVGQAPDDVTCPDDLEAKVDASVVCTLTDGPNTYDVTATVTSVNDDGTADFDIQVANQAN